MIGQPQSRSEPHGSEDGSLAELFELQDQAQALQRQLTNAADQIANHTGTGGAGAVKITVNADGYVTAVELSRSWRRTLAESQVEDAVIEAVTNAGMQRLAAWTEAVAEREGNSSTEHNAPVGSPEQVQRKEDLDLQGLPDGPGKRAAANEVLDLLEGIEDELDSLQDQVAQAASQSVEGYSPSHTVCVIAAAGGQVTGVTIQRRFLRTAGPERLERELQAAFQEAYQRAGTLTVSNVMGESKLAKIQELVRDRAGMSASNTRDDR